MRKDKKIDIYEQQADGGYKYVASTQWQTTCKNAVKRYKEIYKPLLNIKASFSK